MKEKLETGAMLNPICQKCSKKILVIIKHYVLT